MAMFASTSMVRATDTTPPNPPALPNPPPPPVTPAAPITPATPSTPAAPPTISPPAPIATDAHPAKKHAKVRKVNNSDFTDVDFDDNATVIEDDEAADNQVTINTDHDVAKGEDGVLDLHE